MITLNQGGLLYKVAYGLGKSKPSEDCFWFFAGRLLLWPLSIITGSWAVIVVLINIETVFKGVLFVLSTLVVAVVLTAGGLLMTFTFDPQLAREAWEPVGLLFKAMQRKVVCRTRVHFVD